MKMKPTLTIGIPAYNESNNIIRLLNEIHSNRQSNYRLEKVIIVSDGSTDDTSQKVKQYPKGTVVLVQNKIRHGQVYAQNEIIKRTASDYLLLLNADTKISDLNFISLLLAPLIESSVHGISSARVVPLSPITFIDKVISWSHTCKTEMYETNPDSIFLCHGRARALSRALYSKLVFPRVIAEDAYSYLFAKKMGFTFAYAKDARIYFRSPSNLNDHLLQSQRFFRGKEELSSFFSRELLTSSYRLPRVRTIFICLRSAIQNPILAFAYAIIIAVSVLTVKRNLHQTHVVWKTSESSKHI